MKGKFIADHSKFWLGDDFSAEKIDVDTTYGLIKLSAYRRAIANFVYILTGKNIPVRFAEKNTSQTDGKVIYIGGELSKGEFDPTVGLSLHEASHIVKSDFDLIKTLWGKLPSEISKVAKGKFNQNELAEFTKYILNVVEDRYIDAWVYVNAPGYRGYYQALYDRYFNLPEVDRGLKSQDFREPTLKNYKFRFTNITNENTDLDALPNLRKIYGMLDLKNILRDDMSTPKGRLDLTYKIVEEMITSIIKSEEEEKKNPKKQKNENSDGDGESSPSDESDSNSDGENDEESSSSDADDSDDILGGIDGGSPSSEKDEKEEKPSNDLPDKVIEKINKIIEKQESIVQRNIPKSPFDSKVVKKLQTMEKSGVSMVEVGGEAMIPKVQCIFVENMTKELMDTEDFPYTSKWSPDGQNSDSARGVSEGMLLGSMLGRKLQIRNEVRTTKFNRLDRGKIDKRMISAIGYDMENIFYQTHIDKYKNVNLHISVDASSSMQPKWRKTMTMLVAIAKAVSMINNVNLVISLRSTLMMRNNSLKELPYVVIAYDSRKDKFSKITQLFPRLFPNGSTPEGLAFQAIMDHIPAGNYESDSYFVNLSDGEPAFHPSYMGLPAAMHTKKQVEKIVAKGIDVISYYVETDINKNSVNFKLFKMMYGKDAQFIDTKNVTQIALTMNKKFLEKAA